MSREAPSTLPKAQFSCPFHSLDAILIRMMLRVAVVCVLAAQVFGQVSMSAAQVRVSRLLTITDKRGNPVTPKLEHIRVTVDGSNAEIVSLKPLKELPLTAAVVVDYSGSMADRDSILLDYTKSVLGALQEFGATSYVCFYNVHIVCNSREEGKTELLALLPNIRPNGNADVKKAIDNASSLLMREDSQKETIPARIIFLITNGELPDEQPSIADVVQNLNSDVTIFPIGLLKELHAEQERKTLLSLAAAGGGHAIFTEDPDGVKELLKKTLESEFQLVFSRPEVRSSPAQIRIETTKKIG